MLRVFRFAVFTLLLLALGACNMPGAGDAGQYQATIHRTAGGIPHIVADDIGSMGFATLYAMAEDNVCIMARHYAKLGARQVEFFGPSQENLSNDWFYQLLIDRGHGEEVASAEIDALFAGGAAGYNHFLANLPAGGITDPDCAGQPWVQPVEPMDVRRVSRTDLFLDYMRPMMVAAQPPQTGAATAAGSTEPAVAQFVAAVDALLEAPKAGGSNAIAIGADASTHGGGLLLANPHMPWKEPFQRFYPMHQILRGSSADDLQFNIMGANLVGRARVGFGVTEHLAWSNTVSKANRNSFYRLTLVPGKPTHYLFDGKEYAMLEERVVVRHRAEDGTVTEYPHTFYSTHFGAMLVRSEVFTWTQEHAYALRFIDTVWRGQVSTFEQYAARTIDEFLALNAREQFMMVNLIAADSEGTALYADIGPLPLVTDAQLADCGVMGGAALDGSRSECQWGSHPDAAAPGLYPASALPALQRKDYALNSNDSYWVSHARAHMEGYPSIIGQTHTERTLRTRSAITMVERAIAANDDGLSLDDLLELMFSNESYAGQVMRDDVVAMCREHGSALASDGSRVDLSAACDVLAQWDLHTNNDSRGAHLFRELLFAAHGGEYIRYYPASFVPAVPFQAASPLTTPAGLAADNPAVLVALADAVQKLQADGTALDAALGDIQFVTRNDQRIPIHGGQEISGVFNKVESDYVDGVYPDVTRWSASWIWGASFEAGGPRIKGLLSYSLSANPNSPHYADQTQRYSDKQWLDLPFTLEEVRAASLRSYTLSAPRQ